MESREEVLVREFQRGDEDAFRTLFDRHERLMRARIGRSLPAAVQRRLSISDVLQETRIVAMEQRAEFEARGPGAFRKWIVGIAEMRARRAIRKHLVAAKRAVGREVTRGRRGDTAGIAGGLPSPSQAAIASELAELAREALASLPPDYREVLRLTREEQLDLREAAERMGRSYEATKKLCGRALARFSEALRARRGETHG